jgi:hypothetical protein
MCSASAFILFICGVQLVKSSPNLCFDPSGSVPTRLAHVPRNWQYELESAICDILNICLCSASCGTVHGRTRPALYDTTASSHTVTKFAATHRDARLSRCMRIFDSASMWVSFSTNTCHVQKARVTAKGRSERLLHVPA